MSLIRKVDPLWVAVAIALLALALLLGTVTSAHAADPRCTGSPKSHDFIYRNLNSADPNNDSGKWVQEWCDVNGNLQQRDLWPAFRDPTGVKGSKWFDAGNIVWATKIVYADGTTFTDCMLATSQGGQATNGVVNPTIAEELANRPRPCGAPTTQQASQPAPAAQVAPAMPAPYSRVETGQNGSLRFNPGDRVVGANMRLDNGRVVGYCTIDKAPVGGTVYGGYIGSTLPGEPVPPPCAL